jgi:competence protein ComEA
MHQRPLYQTAIALLTVAFLAGAAYYLIAPGAPPGIEISLPTPAEPPQVAPFTPVDGTPVGGQATAADGRININTASAAELAAHLQMIGPARAQDIVNFREANGPFERPDLLTRVPGIGEGILALNWDLITVGD